MYNCEECGGFVEELGDMAVSSGGCVCAQKKAEESANSLQQLKTEIAALADEVYQMSLLHPSEQSFSGIVDRMRQLSAV